MWQRRRDSDDSGGDGWGEKNNNQLTTGVLKVGGGHEHDSGW